MRELDELGFRDPAYTVRSIYVAMEFVHHGRLWSASLANASALVTSLGKRPGVVCGWGRDCSRVYLLPPRAISGGELKN